MDLHQYKLNFNQLDNYINSMNRMHIVIDFSTVMRKKAVGILRYLKRFPESRCCFYVTKKFDKQITQLVDDEESGFCTKEILNCILSAWEEYSCLDLHPMGDNVTSNDFLKQLSQNGHTTCLLTGNETEAWRHILGINDGSVLLVTDSCSYFFVEEAFKYLSRQYGFIEKFTNIKIHDDGMQGKCETATMEKSFGFFYKRHIIRYTEVLSGDGAEGVIYKTDDPEIAVKAFYNSVSVQKIKKLEYLIDFEEKKENFAWPLEFIYSIDHFYSEPIGFTMPLFSNIRPLEEITYLDKITNRHRWKIAINFLDSALYLYVHGIQIGDYNFNNFGITNDCKVIFMDIDSYVYGIYGTQTHGKQCLPFAPDYTNRSNVIQADYLLINCMIFWILSDGIWPYYYNEDMGYTVCRITIDSEKEFHNILNKFPNGLRKYYKNLFIKGKCEDPFELLFILFDAEEYFLHN